MSKGEEIRYATVCMGKQVASENISTLRLKCGRRLMVLSYETTIIHQLHPNKNKSYSTSIRAASNKTACLPT